MLTAAAAERFVVRDIAHSDHDASAAHAEVLARLDEFAARLARIEGDGSRTQLAATARRPNPHVRGSILDRP
jgi:hypothetical protein